MNIETERLTLQPLSLAQLHALSQGVGMDAGFDISTLNLSHIQISAIRKKITKMESRPAEMHPWYTYWLISMKGSCIAVGLIGFKGQQADGSAEVGYGISPEFEGQGITTEALRAMVGWAFQDPSCLRVTAQCVLRSNLGSQKVLERNGFRKTREDADTMDYELTR